LIFETGSCSCNENAWPPGRESERQKEIEGMGVHVKEIS